MSITIIFSVLAVAVVLLLLMNVRRGTFFFWSKKMGYSNGRSGGSDGDNARK